MGGDGEAPGLFDLQYPIPERLPLENILLFFGGPAAPDQLFQVPQSAIPVSFECLKKGFWGDFVLLD